MKQEFWCTKNNHEIVRNLGCLEYRDRPQTLFNGLKAEYFTKVNEKCKIRSNIKENEVETRMIMVSSNFKRLLLLNK